MDPVLNNVICFFCGMLVMWVFVLADDHSDE